MNDKIISGYKTHWSISLLDYYIRKRFSQQVMPFLASFKLTYRCNLRCKICPFHQKSDETGSHMSWDTAIGALHTLKRMGCRIVVFEGGEPFLWKDGEREFRDLVNYAKRHFLRVAATTNGTFPLDVPVHVLWVSLDGLKGTHDRLRTNSFEKVWSNLQQAKHPKIMVHVTLHRGNWFELDFLLKNIRKLPAIQGVTVQFFYPYERGEEGLMLNAEERKVTVEKIIAFKKQGFPILNSNSRLKAMIDNRWKCHSDLLVNVHPNGDIVHGCYVKKHGEVQCKYCGFTAVAEASGAMEMRPGSLLAGWRTFLS